MNLSDEREGTAVRTRPITVPPTFVPNPQWDVRDVRFWASPHVIASAE